MATWSMEVMYLASFAIGSAITLVSVLIKGSSLDMGVLTCSDAGLPGRLLQVHRPPFRGTFKRPLVADCRDGRPRARPASHPPRRQQPQGWPADRRRRHPPDGRGSRRGADR